MENLIGLGILAALLVIGYFFGRRSELKHYKKIRQQEEKLAYMPVVIGQWKNELDPQQSYELVHGSVVVGSDYFKTFASSIRQIFGGNIASFETLIDRGRREAINRMKLQARALGATKVINMRLETSSIGSNQKGKQGLPSVEVHAYATAVYPPELIS